MYHYVLMKNSEIIDIDNKTLMQINEAISDCISFELDNNTLICNGFEKGLIPGYTLEIIIFAIEQLFGKEYSIGSCNIPHISNNNDDDLMVLNEEILYSNMTDDEKKQKICGYIGDICKDKCKRDTLYITDSYIFPNNYESGYKNLLISIFKELSYKKIVVILNGHRCNNTLFMEIKNELSRDNINIETKHFNGIHDRFWISNFKKGIVMGTSLNGIGAKLCYIDTLKDDDVTLIVDYLKENNLLN